MPRRPWATGWRAPTRPASWSRRARCWGWPGEVVLALPPLPPAEGAALFVQRAAGGEAGLPAERRGPGRHRAAGGTARRPAAGHRAGRGARARDVAAHAAGAHERAIQAARVQGRPARPPIDAARGVRLVVGPADRRRRRRRWRNCRCSRAASRSRPPKAVLDLSDCDEAPWTVDVVHSLVDKSFVRPRGDDRFDLLVSVQVYAAEHLQTEGRFAGSGPQALHGGARSGTPPGSPRWGRSRRRRRRCADLDNLVAACRRAVSLGDGDCAAGALEGAWAALQPARTVRDGCRAGRIGVCHAGLGDRAAAHAVRCWPMRSWHAGARVQQRALYEQGA